MQPGRQLAIRGRAPRVGAEGLRCAAQVRRRVAGSGQHPLIAGFDLHANLVRNAIEAMTGGGRLVLESVSGVYRAGRAGAEIVVRDTGPGLPEEVLAALYAPKRSRKGGEHAGLGLHITARLVDELEGAIDVRTQKGKGTTFSVFLPDLTP